MIIVCGLQGVGKTALLKRIRKRNKVVAVGQLMSKFARARGIIKKKDEIWLLKKRLREKLQKDFFADTKFEPDCILNTHLLIFTPRGIWKGFNKAIISRLDISKIIVIVKNASALKRQIERDKMRQRSQISAKELMERQRLVILEAKLLGKMLDCPVVLLVNDKIVDSVKRLNRIL